LNNDRRHFQSLAESILKRDRIALAKAITLVESHLPQDREISDMLIQTLLPATGNSVRIGISGSPGVGKSTFIEALGKYLIAQNKTLAVLSVDPTSQVSHGSILGDKTRMDELSKNQSAFIRPSAAGQKLGGVGLRTRESILLCEAAGFEIIIVETVGVGQSEIEVKGMTDFFVLLMLARSGDELQAIKKGITEMADAVVITKADGDNVAHAKQAQSEILQALHDQFRDNTLRQTPVLLTSAYENSGIDKTWETIETATNERKTSGHFQQNRDEQKEYWLKEYFDHLIESDVAANPDLQRERSQMLAEIKEGKSSVASAAKVLLRTFYESVNGKS
jgi:LAO/AO transport system kinase